MLNPNSCTIVGYLDLFILFLFIKGDAENPIKSKQSQKFLIFFKKRYQYHMPNAWYVYVGAQNGAAYNVLANYIFFPGVPACCDGNALCAIYAFGPLIGGVQAVNPTNIAAAQAWFADAFANGTCQPPADNPFLVRMKVI